MELADWFFIWAKVRVYLGLMRKEMDTTLILYCQGDIYLLCIAQAYGPILPEET